MTPTRVVEITVTDGKTPLAGVTVRGESAGVFLGEVTTGPQGRARFQQPPRLPPGEPLKISVTGQGRSVEEIVAWSTPYYQITLRPSWWWRVWEFLLWLLPTSVKDWIKALGVVLLGIYVVVCGTSWVAFGLDPFNYNARCAQMAVESATRSAKPGTTAPEGHTSEVVHVSLEANVPQFLSHEVHVKFTVDALRAVPLTGRDLSPDGRVFNEAWAKYEQAARDAAAKNEAPSAIKCPIQEIETLRRIFDAGSGKEGSH
jgi:hypothetical protein